MEEKINSWAVRWCYHLYKNKLMTVYPRISKTNNIGFDGSGTHCGYSNLYDETLMNMQMKCKFEKIGVNKKLGREAAHFSQNSILGFILHQLIRWR